MSTPSSFTATWPPDTAKPVRIRDLAYRAVLTQLRELSCDAMDEFLAMPYEAQKAWRQQFRLESPFIGIEPQNNNFWKWLTLKKVVIATHVLTERILDASYRLSNPNQGKGFRAAMSEALNGDKKTLLDLVRVFPSAQTMPPLSLELDKGFLQDGAKGKFAAAYSKAMAAGQRLDHRAKHQEALLFLCLNVDLVLRHAAGILTLRQLTEILFERGIAVPEYDAFQKWFRRTFKDLLSPSA